MALFWMPVLFWSASQIGVLHVHDHILANKYRYTSHYFYHTLRTLMKWRKLNEGKKFSFFLSGHSAYAISVDVCA
jgi:hypothetical protein